MYTLHILNSKRQNKNKTQKKRENEKNFPPAGFEPGIPPHIAVPRPLGYGAMC